MGTPARVLVTGAASGIGAATARRFRLQGDRVAGLDRDAERLRTVELDHASACDVSDEDEVVAAVEQTAATLGGLDVIVCSAGIAPRGSAPDTDVDTWDRTFAVNVRGAFLTARAALPYLREGTRGTIIMVASQLGLVAAQASVAYCASKGALVQLTRAMALDHAAEGITVNALCPGPTYTPLSRQYFDEGSDPGAERRRFEDAMPIGRSLDPEEVAAAAVYLATPEARGVTGSTLVIDGGYIAA